ncbi:MAG TPA: enoyl-CoA hydratase/isomerase family protein [Chthonomonadaceae bacterium]|nr:enoyl-CoA hydratase/isomerase family protein [Chthonomonadaceae bacterium]
MNPTRLLVDQRQAVVTITLNRPDLHNALDEILIEELTGVFTQSGSDPGVRAIVLKGAGPSFCAGGDLNWMTRVAQYSHAENLADARELQQLFNAIAECPKVTIAQVHGAAMGGGVGLVAVCDIAIAAADTKFAFSEVRIGLAPAVIAPYVIEKIGYGAARALFVTGERFGADEALRIGLVQQVVPADELEAAVQRKAESVLQTGPEAVAAAKRLLRDIEGKTPPEAAEATVACIAALRASPEGQEGIRAFLEKRKPDFSA